MSIKLRWQIPFAGVLQDISWKGHSRAFKKFFILWVLSSLPVVFAILFSTPEASDLELWEKFKASLRLSYTVSDVFVYSAAFLSPLLLIIFEKYNAMAYEEDRGIKIHKAFKRVFPCYYLMWGAALIVLFVISWAFSVYRMGGDELKETLLYLWIPDFHYYVYVFALFAWYLTIWDRDRPVEHYFKEMKNSEDTFSTGFSERLSKKGKS